MLYQNLAKRRNLENRMSKQVEEQNKLFDDQKFSQSQVFGNRFRGNGFRGSNRVQRGSYNNSNYRSRGNFRGYGRSRGYRGFNNFNNQFSLTAENNFNILLMLHSLRRQRRKTFNRSKNNKQQVMSNQLFKFFNQLKKHMFLLLNMPKSFAISAVIQIILQLIAQCDHVDAEMKQIFRSNGLQKTR